MRFTGNVTPYFSPPHSYLGMEEPWYPSSGDIDYVLHIQKNLLLTTFLNDFSSLVFNVGYLIFYCLLELSTIFQFYQGISCSFDIHLSFSFEKKATRTSSLLIQNHGIRCKNYSQTVWLSRRSWHFYVVSSALNSNRSYQISRIQFLWLHRVCIKTHFVNIKVIISEEGGLYWEQELDIPRHGTESDTPKGSIVYSKKSIIAI